MSKEIYLGWWEKNKQNILANEFSLLDKNIIANTLQDKLKGINLISFLPKEINTLVDNFLKTFPKEIIENSWIIP